MPLYLEYHGNRGLIVVSKGTLNTDYYGLDTATAVWKCPMDTFGSLAPGLRSRHPVWTYLVMEKRQVEIQPGFAMITGEYAGITGGRTPSVFECSFGNSDEPIESHPKFLSEIAGKPSTPLNGAIFVDPKTHLVTTNDAAGKSEFRGFAPYISGSLNAFAGIESYLASQVTIRETWIATSRLSGINNGKINTPPIAIAITGNWLQTGASFQQRGDVYQNTLEWRASGPRQWNATIYG